MRSQPIRGAHGIGLAESTGRSWVTLGTAPWPQIGRRPTGRLVADADTDEARLEGGHRLVLGRWTVVVLSARLVVVRRVDLRHATVEQPHRS